MLEEHIVNDIYYTEDCTFNTDEMIANPGDIILDNNDSDNVYDDQDANVYEVIQYCDKCCFVEDINPSKCYKLKAICKNNTFGSFCEANDGTYCYYYGYVRIRLIRTNDVINF